MTGGGVAPSPPRPRRPQAAGRSGEGHAGARPPRGLIQSVWIGTRPCLEVGRRWTEEGVTWWQRREPRDPKVAQ